MSEDFVTRLQLQLREAAEREERSGSARRLARAAGAQQLWKPALALAAIALAALAVMSAAGSLHHRRTTPVGPGPHVVLRKQLISQPGGLWVGFGSAWAIDDATGQLVRVDPRTAGVRARISVGRVDAFDIGAGAAWVVAGGRLDRIDPDTDRIADRIRLPFAHGFVLVGRDAVWVGDGLALWRVDPRKNAIDRHIDLGRSGYQPSGGATDGRRLYLSRADGTLLVVDAHTGARLPSPGVEVNGSAVFAARGTVFLAGDKALSALDARTGRTLWSQDLGAQINDAVPVGRAIWVQGSPSGGGRDRLWRLDAATGRVTGSLTLRDFGAAGMAPVDGRLWLLSLGGVLQVIE